MEGVSRQWTDTKGAQPLAPEESRALLQTRSAGQLGLTKDALPVVIPVTYTIEKEHVWICAGPGMEARSPSRRDVVAFQTGASVAGDGWLWSVMVQGRTEPVPVGPSEEPGRMQTGPCLLLSIDVITGWQFGGFDVRSYLASAG